MLKHFFLIIFSCSFVSTFVIGQSINPENLIGEYTAGTEFFGSTITIEPNGSYKKESGGDGDFFESGNYLLDSGILHFNVLKATRTNLTEEFNLLKKNAKGESAMPSSYELVPIKWAKRIYLIKSEDLKEFINAINLGLEPRNNYSSRVYLGSFYVRAESNLKFSLSSIKPIIGVPELPDEWKSFLLKKPITAKVLSVEGEKTQTATIDKGKLAGLKVGMRLVINNREPSLWSGEVISVKNQTAKIYSINELEIGDKISSKFIYIKTYRGY